MAGLDPAISEIRGSSPRMTIEAALRSVAIRAL